MLLLRSYISLSMDCQSQGRTDVDRPQKQGHLSGLFYFWNQKNKNKKENFRALQRDL